MVWCVCARFCIPHLTPLRSAVTVRVPLARFVAVYGYGWTFTHCFTRAALHTFTGFTTVYHGCHFPRLPAGLRLACGTQRSVIHGVGCVDCPSAYTFCHGLVAGCRVTRTAVVWLGFSCAFAVGSLVAAHLDCYTALRCVCSPLCTVTVVTVTHALVAWRYHGCLPFLTVCRYRFIPNPLRLVLAFTRFVTAFTQVDTTDSPSVRHAFARLGYGTPLRFGWLSRIPHLLPTPVTITHRTVVGNRTLFTVVHALRVYAPCLVCSWLLYRTRRTVAVAVHHVCLHVTVTV